MPLPNDSLTYALHTAGGLLGLIPNVRTSQLLDAVQLQACLLERFRLLFDTWVGPELEKA